MRPPEFTGGNQTVMVETTSAGWAASMRPPEFTGGNGAESDGGNGGAGNRLQ